MKYLLNVIESEKMHSGSKAQDDIRFFLKRNGVLNIYIDGEMERFEKYLFLNSLLEKKFNTVKKDDSLIVQYPIYMGRFATSVLKKNLRKVSATKVAFVHDVKTLRTNSSNEEIKKEIEFLSVFDIVIAHSHMMASWLKQHGLLSDIRILGPFDYVNDSPMMIPRKLRNNQKFEVVFAGNLGKSSFLAKIDPKNYQLNLYGINFSQKYKRDGIRYFGSFPPEVLPEKLEGNFGLVWDGDSIEESDQYTKYNSPHKASLYLSMGLPIIVWNNSALAEFVIQNHCGIILKDLNHLNHIIDEVSMDDYMSLASNAKKIGHQMRIGFYTSHALMRGKR